jgi:hypothetical protein
MILAQRRRGLGRRSRNYVGGTSRLKNQGSAERRPMFARPSIRVAFSHIQQFYGATLLRSPDPVGFGTVFDF